MSHLKVYWPESVDEDAAEEVVMDDGNPAILRMSSFLADGPAKLDTVSRARAIRSNSRCPFCDTANVEPIELDDAVISPRSRLPIPGTATLVGFHCHACEAEWPVYRQA